MLIFRGHCKRSSAPGQNILRHLERKVSSTLSSQSPVKAGWGMTDVTLKEGDTCPGPGWVPGRPPHDTEQATVSLSPGFSLTNAVGNSVSYWGAVKIKSLLPWKCSGFVTRSQAGRCHFSPQLDVGWWSCCALLGKPGRKARDPPKSEQVSVTYTKQTRKPVSVSTVSKLKPA